jgi:hypothetical protein
MLVALAATLLVAPASAADKPPKCNWKGEAVDAFTGKDGRTMAVNYYGTYGMEFHRPVDGVVTVDARFLEGGMTVAVADKPVLFLLTDGSVVEMPLQPTAPSTHSASQYGVATIHTSKGQLPLDAVKKFAEVGVVKMRFTLPTKEFNFEMDKGDVKEFTNLSRCLLEP